MSCMYACTTSSFQYVHQFADDTSRSLTNGTECNRLCLWTVYGLQLSLQHRGSNGFQILAISNDVRRSLQAWAFADLN